VRLAIFLGQRGFSVCLTAAFGFVVHPAFSISQVVGGTNCTRSRTQVLNGKSCNSSDTHLQ
jgi:hypothetical protein